MQGIYDLSSVVIKLVYYCNLHREVYFKRSEVTDYLIKNNIFDIPNKQGFDGNLSYFGFDVQNDVDNNRILLLRGDYLNKECLQGSLKFNFMDNSVRVVTQHSETIHEIDSLIKNKTREAKIFNINKEIMKRRDFKEHTKRVYGNKKIFTKDEKFYLFPRVIIDENSRIIYEITNSEKLVDYNPYIIFITLSTDFTYNNEIIISYEHFFYGETLGYGQKDFYYFILENNEPIEIDIQDRANTQIISLLNNYQYDLSEKPTTSTILTNSRLNSGTLRTLALQRDNNTCLLCEINDSRLLICSHIKPWRTGESRLDLNNVLTLCELHDSLFDKGFITIDEDGYVMLSEEVVLNKQILYNYFRDSESALKLELNESVKNYLKYHRENIFLGPN